MPSRASAPIAARSGRRRRTRKAHVRSWPRSSAFREAKVTLNVTLLGGGFGRKSKPDFIAEAALLVRSGRRAGQGDLDARGRDPPRLLSRDLGPASRGRARRRRRRRRPGYTGRSSPRSNRPSRRMWSTARAGELGQGVTDMPYDVANIRCENGPAANHVRIGWYRSVYNIPHAFAVCSFADELAAAAGTDPLTYLRRLIGAAAHARSEGRWRRLSQLRRLASSTIPIDTGAAARSARARRPAPAAGAGRCRRGRARHRRPPQLPHLCRRGCRRSRSPPMAP